MLNHQDSSSIIKKKFYITCFLLLLFCGSAFSQTTTEKEGRRSVHKKWRTLRSANNYYERTYYSKALELFNKIENIQEELESLEKIANCYYYIGDYDTALKLYETLFTKFKKEEDFHPEFFMYENYAHTLKTKNRYKEAYALIKKYYTNKNDTILLEEYKRRITSIENLRNDPPRYQIDSTISSINSIYSEFGAIEVGDSLVFSSSKRKLGLLEGEDGRSGEGYLDIYSAKIQRRNKYSNMFFGGIEPLPETINSPVHEGNTTFSKDGNTIYLTSNTLRRRSKRNFVNTLGIFTSVKDGKSWKKRKMLKIGNQKYSYEHPSLNEEQNLLFFASDMPGGYGSFDLYYIDLDNPRNPINLGPNINTEKTEQFPFISDNGVLYFSSDGHPGYGGLDLFASLNIEGSGYQTPVNLGLPTNSAFDDFSMTMNSEHKVGFYASNRPSGKGKDDIYKMIEIIPVLKENCKQFIKGKIRDSLSQEELLGTKLLLMNKGAQKDSLIYEGGYYKFEVSCGKKYAIIAKKEAYKTAEKDTIITDFLSGGEQLIHIEMNSLETIKRIESNKFKDDTEKYEEEKVVIAVTNIQDIRGRVEQTKKNLQNDDRILKVNSDTLFVDIEKIYFDYDKWYLRKKSRDVLDDVVRIMEEYPLTDLTIAVHSDSRGSSRYNLSLSERRAKSIKDYLVHNEVDEDRIIPIGYGETRPKIDCKIEDCGEEEFEINRRCDFLLEY